MAQYKENVKTQVPHSIIFYQEKTSTKILEQLNNFKTEEVYLDNNEYHLNNPTPLFMRISEDEK